MKPVPFAFTEHGAIMAASVLNSDRAVEASVEVVQAFVRVRQMVLSHADLARRVGNLEQQYDKWFKSSVCRDPARYSETSGSLRSRLGAQAAQLPISD